MCNYHFKLVEHMVSSTPKTIVGLFLLSGMFLIAYSDFIPYNILLIWVILQAIFIFIRYLNTKNLEKYLALKDEVKVKKHVKILLVSIIYSAFVWNFAFIASIIYSPKDYEFISFAMMMGILTAGVISLSSMYRVFVIYFILMISPLTVTMFYFGGHGHYTILLFVSIYIPTILILAKSVNKSIVDASNVNDLLELKVNELKQLSVTDFLTNLYNRRYFFETAKKIIELSKREEIEVSLLMIDIDYFKKINDTYGHQIGDVVLVEMTKYINSMTRVSDIFARIGGEEFALLLYNTSLENAKEIAQKICKSIDEKIFSHNEIVIDVTVSIGFSTLGEEIGTLEELYKDADSNLYQAKENGRNRVV